MSGSAPLFSRLSLSNRYKGQYNRENPRVINLINGFVHWLVQEFSVDGLRVDTVKHVRKSFWPNFEVAAGVFCTGEVLHGGESKYVLFDAYTDLDIPLFGNYGQTPPIRFHIKDRR